MVHVFTLCVCVWVTLTHQQVVTDGNPSADLCSLDEEACLEQEVFLSLEAIGSLHRTMDEDEDGNIDVTETDEFLKDSQSRQRLEVRGQRFFTSDLHISLEEMWSSWKHSEVYNWTVEQVSDWLVNCVELPQYADVFASHGLDGRALPRLAVKNTTLMVSVLRITDRGHAHKLHLKALDTVLFGAPAGRQGVIKDVLLVCSLLAATAGCWFAVVQKRRSREQLERLSELGTHLEGLHTAENTLRELQDRLQEAEDDQCSVQEVKAELQEKLRDHMTSVQLEADRLRELEGSAHSHMTRHRNIEEELEQMRAALRLAERQMVEHHRWVPVDGLERWLQFTHEVELQNYNTQKHSAERQLLQAREGAEKIKRKRTSLFGHSSSLEDINHKIMSAKQALGEVTAALRERLIRWRQIEMLTGFSLVNNPGLPALAKFLKVDASFLGLRPSTPTRHFLLSDDLDDMDEDILSPDTLKYAAWQMDRRVSDLWPLSGIADNQSAWKSSALSLLPRKQRMGDSQRDVFLSQSDTDSAYPAVPHSQSQCSVAPKPLPLPPFKPLPPPQRGRGFITSSPVGGSLEKSSSLGELRGGEEAGLSALAPPLMSSSYSTQAIYTSSPPDPAQTSPPHGHAPDSSSSNRDADRRREAEPEDREGGAQKKHHTSTSLNRMFKKRK